MRWSSGEGAPARQRARGHRTVDGADDGDVGTTFGVRLLTIARRPRVTPTPLG